MAADVETDVLRRLMEEQFAKQAKLLEDVHVMVKATNDTIQSLHGPGVGDVSIVLQSASSRSEVNSQEIPENAGVDSLAAGSWADSMIEANGGLDEHQKQAIRMGQKMTTLPSVSFEDVKYTNLAGRIVSSNIFSNGVQLLIMINLIILGVEVDISANLRPGEEPPIFEVVNNIIVVLFLGELLMKWAAYGCREFFCGPERLWNIFDFVIVGLSLLETAMEFLTQAFFDAGEMNSSHLRVMRFARLARALRGVRVIRLLRYISSLRTIVFSIVSTMSSLLWTLVLLVMLFYCFGVFITQLVTDHCRYQDGLADCPQDLTKFWASVGDSMLTLYLSITGGLSWEEALRPLQKVNPLAVISLLVYITITIFAVLNVVTGVFCNTAIESARADKDIAIMKQMHKHEAQVQSLREIFNEIDNGHTSVVSLKQLKEALQSKKLASFMHSMDISTQDIWTLFMVIDANGDGQVTLDEFVFGCMQLQGPAKGLQMARMSYENTMMREEIKRLQYDFRGIKELLKPQTALQRSRSRSQLRELLEHKQSTQPLTTVVCTVDEVSF